MSLPAAAEVVTRNLGANCDSIVTMDPDVAGCKVILDGDSGVLITKNASVAPQNCQKPIVFAGWPRLLCNLWGPQALEVLPEFATKFPDRAVHG